MVFSNLDPQMIHPAASFSSPRSTKMGKHTVSLNPPLAVCTNMLKVSLL